MFVNITNHPSNKWSEEQVEAARSFGNDGDDDLPANQILDIPFTDVPATASTTEVVRLSRGVVDEVIFKSGSHPISGVLVQGEATLQFALVHELWRRLPDHVQVVAACSSRSVRETVNQDGTSVKTSVFRFVQFRAYKRG